VAGSCKHSNEPLGSIKGGGFLDFLSDYQLLRKDFALWSLLSWLVGQLSLRAYVNMIAHLHVCHVPCCVTVKLIFKLCLLCQKNIR
jgi:hypothetical protein